MNKILVIEDSKTINNIIKKELTKLDFDVDQAFRYKEAKEKLENNEYKLIILDLHLPDGEGSELIANIQSLTKTKVVVLTARQDDDLREELFQYGILDYIIKDTNLIYSISEITKIIHKVEDVNKENILIIDDSKFICKQIKTILEPRNYLVSYAYTAQDGLVELKAKDYDLLILDMELPDMHGLKVLEIIRRDSAFLTLPIIVLSGTSSAEVIRNVLKNGSNDFLKKPFVFEEFILKVDLWIDYYKKDKALEEKTRQLQYLNNNLEKLVIKEVEKSRKKDKLMFQQNRLMQMGEMIAMIAHQWRQPLNSINAAISVLDIKAKQKKLDNKTVEKISSKIYKYVDYLSSTIDDFRDFFRPEKEMTNTNFEKIINKALVLIESSLKNNNIELNLNIKDVKEFLTFENELIQVVLNLLKNAQDVLIQQDKATSYIDIMIDGKVMCISDNGGGIDNEIIEKIFDPYFSTKMKKEGTGLGLYMSKLIVEEHCKGKLSVTNTSQGAKFCIDLN
jgi:DNA-binding response OmpR family regulator